MKKAVDKGRRRKQKEKNGTGKKKEPRHGEK